jgi:ribosomal protein L22
MQVHMDNAKQSVLFWKRFEYVVARLKSVQTSTHDNISFVHIPKCADTFLAKVLKKYSEDSNNGFLRAKLVMLLLLQSKIGTPTINS